MFVSVMNLEVMVLVKNILLLFDDDNYDNDKFLGKYIVVRSDADQGDDGYGYISDDLGNKKDSRSDDNNDNDNDNNEDDKILILIMILVAMLYQKYHVAVHPCFYYKLMIMFP